MAKFRNGYLLFNTGTQANKILDEDNMVSNDDTALPTQQSVKAYVDNKTSSSGPHGLDSTSHIGISGTEDDFMSINSDGLPKDSGKKASDFEDAGAVTTHESTYNHSKLHEQIHGLDSTSHIGISGTEDNFMSINSEGLPKDSGSKASDFENAGAVTTHESTYNHLKLHDQIHGLDSTSHIGISGTENNFMSINSEGLPKDSGSKASDFVTKGLEDTLVFNASRNSNKTTNIYLRNSDSTPTNMSPFILPWNCTLIAISVCTYTSCTWIAEVHSGGSLVTGAFLSIAAAIKGYSSSYNINFNAGDDIELYCNGNNIDRPRIIVVFRRR